MAIAQKPILAGVHSGYRFVHSGYRFVHSDSRQTTIKQFRDDQDDRWLRDGCMYDKVMIKEDSKMEW